MLFSAVTSFVRAALPAPPARVLEIGAGDGALAAVLAEAGYDVVAIDPSPEGAGVREMVLLEVDEPDGSFDAAVAVVSLHHVEPLEPSLRRLGALLRPGGLLVVDEIDVKRFDERAAAWLIEHRGPVHEHYAPDGLVAEMRGHLHSLERIRAGLAGAFALGEPVRGAYLYRWGLPPGLRDPEEELVAAGRLPAVGARLVGTRR
jgi:SAM-dependent methyltransferase